jgi:UvrD-like helicase C-terminal domain/AAA domain/Nuclease-related domain
MAQMIPNDPGDGSTDGEKLVFNILRRLPDDVIVYFEPYIDDLYPDFVVILPSLGVLLIEVKDWSMPHIAGANPHFVNVRFNGKVTSYAHPTRQVRTYKFRLRDQCRKHKQLAKLVNRKGRHTGKFQFPFVSLVILPNITRAEIDSMAQGSAIFPSKNVATKDQVINWKKQDGESLLNSLKPYFTRYFSIGSMTENQVNIVKAILYPEILLALDFNDPEQPTEPTVKLLDKRQEELARDIGAGHRLIFGVAGSGKTVLLIARAKLVAKLTPKARVLVLCYNNMLSVYLADALRSCHSVAVRTFHGWARDKRAGYDRDDDSELGEQLLATIKEESSDTKKYDTILIDEAQDFDSSWFPCVLAAMKDPVNGDLLIMGDGSQGLYRRRKVSWKQLGIQAQGRTQYLEHNYRNTRLIVELATRFASGTTDTDEDGLSAPLVDPDKCVRIAGSSTVLITKKSKPEEVDRVVRIVNDLLEGRWFGEPITPLKPEQIGILYRLAHPLIRTLRENLEKSRRDCPVIWLTEKDKDARHRIAERGVKILTMHGSKGLQFRAVILMFADDCPASFSDTTEEAERCLFYVALTRAEDYLAISCSRTSGFAGEIEVAGEHPTTGHL